MIPIDRLVDKRARFFRAGDGHTKEGRAREGVITLRWCQGRYSNHSGVAEWTRRLISNIERWVGMDFGETEYFMTQFLTGYGCFKEYLNRVGRAEDAEYP